MKAVLVVLVGAMFGATGCIVDFDTQQENSFSCKSDADCLGQSSCVIQDGEEFGYCGRSGGGNNGGDCIDSDEDGWGEGSTCRGPDCDDSDPEVNPGALEICDGKDNNCDCVVEEDDCADDNCEL